MTPPRSLRWALVLADFEPVVGHEQGGSRRALVVSRDALHRRGLMSVCPITAAFEVPRSSVEVPIPAGEAGQTRSGLILCDQVRTVSVLRAVQMLSSGSRLDYLTDPAIRAAVRHRLAVHLGLDRPGLLDGASINDAFGI